MIRVIAWPIAMLVWAIAGFYVGIPAIVLAAVFFMVSVFIAAFGESRSSMRTAEEWLREILKAYPDGFASIHQVLFGGDHDESSENSSAEGEGASEANGASGSKSKKSNFFEDLFALAIVAGIGLVVATVFWYFVGEFLDDIL